jgi:hypothetical protein
MRPAARIVLGLGLVAAAGGALVLLFAGRIAAAAIHGGGTWALGVPVATDDVSLGLLAGTFELEGLTVANPPGFAPVPFLEIAGTSADWRTSSLFAREIEVGEIALTGLTLRLEQRLDGSNYGAILDHLERVAPAKPAPAPETAESRTLRVARIVITDVTAELALPDLPAGADRARVRVPEIVIEDFRSDGETSEVLGKLLGAIVEASLEASLEAGGATFPADWSKDLRAKLGAGAEAEVRGLLEGAVEGLFGPKKPR